MLLNNWFYCGEAWKACVDWGCALTSENGYVPKPELGSGLQNRIRFSGSQFEPELKIIRLAQYYIFLVTFGTSGTQNWDTAFRIRIRFLESDPVLRTRSCFQSKLGPILRGRFYIYSQHSHLINMQFRANSHPSYPTKRQQAINYLVLRWCVQSKGHY